MKSKILKYKKLYNNLKLYDKNQNKLSGKSEQLSGNTEQVPTNAREIKKE